jgi:hypothetical protein
MQREREEMQQERTAMQLRIDNIQRELDRVTRSAQDVVPRTLNEKCRMEAELASVKEAVRLVANRYGYSDLQDFSTETLIFLAVRILFQNIFARSGKQNCGACLQVGHF